MVSLYRMFEQRGIVMGSQRLPVGSEWGSVAFELITWLRLGASSVASATRPSEVFRGCITLTFFRRRQTMEACPELRMNGLRAHYSRRMGPGRLMLLSFRAEYTRCGTWNVAARLAFFRGP